MSTAHTDCQATPTTWTTDDIADLEGVVELGGKLNAGDNVEYVDDGGGSGGYVEGCGDDRDWVEIAATLRARDLHLIDVGGQLQVQVID